MSNPRDVPPLHDVPLFMDDDQDPTATTPRTAASSPGARLAAETPRVYGIIPGAPTSRDPRPQHAPAPPTPPAPWKVQPGQHNPVPGPVPGPGTGALPRTTQQTIATGSPTHVPGLSLINHPTALTSDSAARDGEPDRGGGVDWALVNAFRVQASRQLTETIKANDHLSASAQRELGRTIILEILNDSARDDLTEGRRSWSPAVQQRMAEAIFDALFGLGRLQPLVDDDRVENIMITGHDHVMLEDADGRLRRGPAVAESDEELLEFLSFLASRSEANARSFSEAQPRLHLRLDGGARLAATAWVTPRPAIVIRRHRLVEVTLGDLVNRGMMTPVAASFLAAAVRSGKSLVISGPQGAGKTTMVRALCAEIPTWERIGTFETEYELFLHEMPGRQDTVLPWEARPGSGERGLNGRQAGEITLADLLVDSFRFNLSRQIVGEVRGDEILAMIKAMQSGAGSISTTHAASAVGAIRKLITCAMEAGPHITESYAQRAISEDIDIIVQLALETHPGPANGTPQRHRYVSEIITVHPGENGPAHTDVFAPAGRGARANVLPNEYAALKQHGFLIDQFHQEAGQTWR